MLADFHKAHVSPYTDVPEVQVLVGWQALIGPDKRGHLFATDRSTLIDATGGSSSIGIGAGHVQSILNRLFMLHSRLDVIDAAALAAFCVFSAKEAVDGCGHLTEVVYIREGEMDGVSPENLVKFDEVFGDYMNHLEPELIACLIGRADIEQLREVLGPCRKQIMQIAAGERAHDPEGLQALRRSTRGRKGRPPSRG